MAPPARMMRVLPTPSPTSKVSGRIPQLDGWRGISISLVILNHSLDRAFRPFAARFPFLPHFATYCGDFGVQIFFVISGFVITRLLLIEERQHGSISIRAFYIRRFFRILPAFYLYIAVALVLIWAGLTVGDWRGLMVAASFLGDFRFHWYNWYAIHAWSLAVEEQFYILFPLFWWLCPQRRRAGVLFGTLAIFLVWSVLHGWGFTASFMTGSSIVGFACVNVGALLAIFELRVLAVLSRWPTLPVVLIFAFYSLRIVPHANVFQVLYGMTVPFVVGLMLMHSVARSGWVASFLKSPVVQWWGLVSYSAYLWQELFTGDSQAYGNATTERAFHMGIVAVPLIAALSFYGIERPCTRFGRWLSGRVVVRDGGGVERGTAIS